MAFTGRSQRVRCGCVPIAFSDMTQCAISARTGLLGIALVLLKRHIRPRHPRLVGLLERSPKAGVPYIQALKWSRRSGLNGRPAVYVSNNPTSDNLTPQETTTQDALDMGPDGAGLSCPGSGVVATE